MIEINIITGICIAFLLCICALTASWIISYILKKDDANSVTGYECGFSNTTNIRFKNSKQIFITYFLIMEAIIVFFIFLNIINCHKLFLLPVLLVAAFVVTVLNKKCL